MTKVQEDRSALFKSVSLRLKIQSHHSTQPSERLDLTCLQDGNFE